MGDEKFFGSSAEAVFHGLYGLAEREYGVCPEKIAARLATKPVGGGGGRRAHENEWQWKWRSGGGGMEGSSAVTKRAENKSARNEERCTKKQ